MMDFSSFCKISFNYLDSITLNKSLYYFPDSMSLSYFMILSIDFLSFLTNTLANSPKSVLICVFIKIYLTYVALSFLLLLWWFFNIDASSSDLRIYNNFLKSFPDRSYSNLFISWSILSLLFYIKYFWRSLVSIFIFENINAVAV